MTTTTPTPVAAAAEPVSTTTEPVSDTRKAYTGALRQIADLLDAHPGIPLPIPITFDLWFHGDDAALSMAATRRIIGGCWNKKPLEGYFVLRRHFGPHCIDLNTLRDKVCQRVVTGTETVTVPDPNAPKVTVERDIVTWVCSHLLEEPAVAS